MCLFAIVGMHGEDGAASVEGKSVHENENMKQDAGSMFYVAAASRPRSRQIERSRSGQHVRQFREWCNRLRPGGCAK